MIRALLVTSLLGLATAHAAEPLRIVAFAGASNLPLWAGQDEGLFARQGLEVTSAITPNSVEMARNLDAGRYDLALTSIDNVVAYDEGEGEGEAALGVVDFVALFGVDNGMLSLIAAPRLTSVAAIGNTPLSVDAVSTGFAFVLRDILGRAGITDPHFVKVGGGAQRLAGLLAGRQDATLLNTPLDVVAESRGFHSLVRVTDALGAYQGVVAAVRRDHVAPDRARLIAFTRGFYDSVAWLADPAHHAAGVQLLARHMPDLSPAAAETAFNALLDPKSGIYRDLRIDPAGLRTVLALRSRYGVPHRELTDPARYVEDTIRTAALPAAK